MGDFLWENAIIALMTIESDFLSFKDPEKFVASVQVKPICVKDVVNAALQKIVRKENWLEKDNHPVASESPIHEIEY